MPQELEVIKSVRQKYPTPLRSEHPAFLLEAARALKFGLLKKPSGNNIPLPDGVKVSADIVVDPKDFSLWDILGDSEGEARPTFNFVSILVDRALFYSVESVPVPTPGNDLEDRVRELEKRVQELEVRTIKNGDFVSIQRP